MPMPDPAAAMDREFALAAPRYTWVHRLHVKVPLESMTDPWWRPENYNTAESVHRLGPDDRWRWPTRRQFFDADAAYKRAHLLKRWGATVRVESRRVEWTEAA